MTGEEIYRKHKFKEAKYCNGKQTIVAFIVGFDYDVQATYLIKFSIKLTGIKIMDNYGARKYCIKIRESYDKDDTYAKMQNFPEFYDCII